MKKNIISILVTIALGIASVFLILYSTGLLTSILNLILAKFTTIQLAEFSVNTIYANLLAFVASIFSYATILSIFSLIFGFSQVNNITSFSFFKSKRK